MTDFPPAAGRGQRTGLVAALVAASLVGLLMAYEFWATRGQILREAETRTFNYAAITEARLDATLRRIDAILIGLQHEIPAKALDARAQSSFAAEVNAEMDRELVNLVEVSGLRVFGVEGNLLYASSSDRAPRINIAERAYFKRVRDDPKAGLVFSEVLPIASTGRNGLVAARALRDPQGVFRGVALAVIDVGLFEKLFQTLDIGARGVMVIRRSDDFSGVVRWPLLEKEINRPLPPGNPVREAMLSGKTVGTVAYPASSDGIYRTYSYRTIAGYPFFILSALAHDDVLADWRRHALAVGTAGALLLAFLGALMVQLWRASEREALSAAEVRESEERLRLATTAGRIGLYDLDIRTGKAVVNAEYASMLGYDPAHFEETNAAWAERLHPEDRERTFQTFRDYVEGRLKTYVVEFRQRTREGGYRWIESCGTIMARDAQGQPLRMLGTHVDITDRKNADEALRSLNAELENRVKERTADLEATNRELETFTYSVSHDLKAPLRGIDGFSKLLLRDHAGQLDAKGMQYLHKVRRATQQMDQLIVDLLAFSRLERRAPDVAAVPVREAIDAVLAEFAQAIGDRNAAVTVNSACDTVPADREGLGIALRNLVGNALKFSAGAVRPEIEIGCAEHDGSNRLWVRDNGIGFDMKYHDQIFTIFERLHSGEQFAGTGVGLAIVRRAMERIGGRVWAESSPGAGATFYLEIPK